MGLSLMEASSLGEAPLELQALGMTSEARSFLEATALEVRGIGAVIHLWRQRCWTSVHWGVVPYGAPE